MTFLPFFTVISPVQDKELILRLAALVFLVVWGMRSRKIPYGSPWVLVLAYFLSYMTTRGGQLNYDCLINLTIPILFFFFYLGKDIRKNMIILGYFITFYVLLVRAGLELPWGPGIHYEFPLIGDKNTVGILLALIFPLTFKNSLHFTVITLGILASNSRSALVAYIIITTIYTIRTKNYVFSFAILFVIILSILNIGTALGTKITWIIGGIETRPQIWGEFLRALLTEPMGFGMGNTFITKPGSHWGFSAVGPHNLLLFLWGNGTLIALAAFSYIVFKSRGSVNRYSLLSYLIAAQFMDFELMGHLFFWILLAQDYQTKTKKLPFRLVIPLTIIATLLVPVLFRFHLSHCLYQTPGETAAERIALLERSIELQPRFTRPVYEHGLWMVKQKRLDMAKRDFEQVMKYQSNFLDTEFLWGQLTRY